MRRTSRADACAICCWGASRQDYDVATSATPEVVLEMFPRTFAVGAHFGVVLVAAAGGRRRIW